MATRLLYGATAIAAALVTIACDRGGSSPSPAPPPVPPVPGTTQVTGRERVSWDQSGDGSQYSYRAYLNGQLVAFGVPSCTASGPSSVCSVALPTMSDGVHSLQIMAVDGSGGESDLSDPIALQKVTPRVAAVSSLTDGGALAAADGLTPAPVAEIIARDVALPAQLAPLPDGRLLVAEFGGQVRVLYPDTVDAAPSIALGAGDLLEPGVTAAAGITAHPDFVTTRHVFVSDVFDGGSAGRRVRVVRLREVGGRLGEPATVFEAAVTATPASDGDAAVAASPVDDGPRLTFGDDGLLYVALPRGLVFDGHPAASRPLPVIARITAEGETPDGGPLSGITAHPLALATDPLTGAVLGLVVGDDGLATLRGFGQNAAASAPAATSGWAASVRAQHDPRTEVLRVLPLDPGTALALPRAIRLAVPVALETLAAGVSGQLADVVTHDGVVFGVVADVVSPAEPTRRTGLVVRLRP